MTTQQLTAQNWTGTAGTTTNLYRQGNIGIGFTAAPTCGSPLEINGDVNMNPASSALRIACTPVLSNLGANNLFVGDNAGSSTTTGIQNTFLGYSNGLANTTGSENTFVGDRAGVANTTGERNCFTGATSGFSSTTGNRNAFLGFESGYNNISGSENVFMGYQSGYTLTTADNNTFVGFGSGAVLTSSSNATILGSNAGGNLGTINESVLIGNEAGYDVLGGSSTALSVIIGYQAATAEGGGSANTAIGYGAAQNMSRFAVENTLVGFHAGNGIQLADANVLIGSSAGTNITTGFSNTLVGSGTNSGATNQNNVALGGGASIASGFDVSTAIGSGALVSTGSNSTAIGVNSVACAPNTIVLGSGTSGSNEVVVVGGCQASFGGIGDLEIIGSSSLLWVNGSFYPSDKRLKKDIQRIETPLSIIQNLNGYTYNYKDTNETPVPLSQDRKAGLMAQELEETFPYPLKKGANGYYGVDYVQLIPLLLEGIKEQQNQIEELKASFGNEEKSQIKSTAPTGDLSQNNPNPFSAFTTIDYEIYGQFSHAELHIYNMSGERRVTRTLLENKASVVVEWHFLEPGIYAYTLVVDGTTVETKTMVVSE